MGASLETADKNHWTPLMTACKMSNLEIAKTLIDAGAAVNTKNPVGDTCISLA